MSIPHHQHPAGKYQPYEICPTPTWIQSDPLDQIIQLHNTQIDQWEDEPVICPLYDTSIHLNNQGAPHYYYRIIQKFQLSSAITDHSTIEIDYVPNLQRLKIHDIQVMRDGKLIDKTGTFHIVQNDTVRHHDDASYSGYSKLKLITNDIQIGDILDVAYSVVGPRSPLHDHFSTTMGLGYSLPMMQRRMAIVSPKGKSIYWKAHGDECDPKIQTFPQDIKFDLTVFETTPKLINYTENQTPPEFILIPYLDVTDCSNWKDVYHIIKPFYKLQDPMQGALASVINIIEKEQQTLEDRIIACINHVQKQFRYQALSEPLHSLRPFDLAQIVKNGFGDCKDKSLLLVSMLNHFGVEAYPALVNMDYPFDPSIRLPSPGVFDHVLVALYYDGKRYWCDPTLSHEEGKLACRGTSVQGLALILNEKEADALTTIVPDEYSNREIHDVFDVSKGDDGVVKVSITSTYKGTYANTTRKRFANHPKKEISKQYIDYYQQDWPNLKPTMDILIEDDTVNNVIIERESYEISSIHDFPENNGYFWIKAKVFLSSLDWPSEGKIRRYPFSTSHPIKTIHRISVIFPWEVFDKNYEFFEEIRNDMVSASKKTTRGGCIELTEYTYETLCKTIELESIETYLNDLEKIYDLGSVGVGWNWVNIEWCRKNLPKNPILKAAVKVKNFVLEYFGWPFWIGMWVLYVILKLGSHFFAK